MSMRLPTPSVPVRPVPAPWPPWTRRTWAPVFWQAGSRRRPKFMHVATQVTPPCGPGRLHTGSTAWGRLGGDAEAGLVWDWIEIAQGVLAMTDPFAVRTNLLLLNQDGDVLPPTAAAVYLSRFVSQLPWQAQVWRAITSD